MNKIKGLQNTGSDKAGQAGNRHPANSPDGNIINNNNSTYGYLLESEEQKTPPANSDPVPVLNATNLQLSQAGEDAFSTLFGVSLVKEFESLVIERQVCFEKSDRRVRAVRTQWNKAKQIISKVGLKDPGEWEMNASLFYFAEPIALSYFQSVLLFLNKFGKFICHKNRHPYVALKMPSGPFKQKMKDRHIAAGGKDQSSKPLTPHALGLVKRKLKKNHYNFLFITLWLGLRPSEVDRLKDSSSWKVEEVNGVTFLSIYQTKLVHLPPEARWKSILINQPQQWEALSMVRSGEFKRPLLTTMSRVFGEGVYLYAGRKGFGAVMMKKDSSLDSIRRELGHSDVRTTKKFYVNAEEVRQAELRSIAVMAKAVKKI